MVLDMNMCYESVFEFIMVFLICQSLDFRYAVFNLLIAIFIYFALFSNKLEKSLKRIFFLLFLGQLTVPHDVISSSGVSDSALPGHPGGKYLFFVSSSSVKMRGFSFLSLYTF